MLLAGNFLYVNLYVNACKGGLAKDAQDERIRDYLEAGFTMKESMAWIR